MDLAEINTGRQMVNVSYRIDRIGAAVLIAGCGLMG
jgi:hypothetical protein